MRKCTLVSLFTLALFSSEGHSATTHSFMLTGDMARKLYDCMPEALLERHPGALGKEAFELSCSSSPAQGNGPIASCSLKSLESEWVRLSGAEAIALFTSLPQELLEGHPGYLLKSAKHVSCGAFAIQGNGPVYRCWIER